MGMYETFITNADELDKSFQTIRSRGVPNTFDEKFLAGMGFERPNTLLFVKLFKQLGLIDSEGNPDKFYYSKFAESEDQAKVIIAKLVSEKYAEILEEDEHVYKLKQKKLLSLFQKQMGSEKSKTIVKLVANTFKELCRYADWKEFHNVDQIRDYLSNGQTKKHNSVKAKTPHEEFILELMNGEEAHEYPINGSGVVKDHPKHANGVKKKNSNGHKPQEKKATTASLAVNKRQNGVGNPKANKESIFLSKALVRRAELLEDMSRHKEAIAAYSDIIKYSDERQFTLGEENILNAYYKRAFMLEKIDKGEKALKAYDDLIKQFG